MEQISKIRTAIIDPGATRTAMRARAYPGEDPPRSRNLSVVSPIGIVQLGDRPDFRTGHFEQVDG